MDHVLKLTPIENEDQSRPILEKKVVHEVAAFEEFFMKSLGNGPLHDYEKAILKTFLLWELDVQMIK